ncbi:MAG: hypothetical protein QF441_05445 [Bacteriovoracaceae bacterium]|nr:hypothetical protein [Bacteriovoracaceae bacterium]
MRSLSIVIFLLLWAQTAMGNQIQSLLQQVKNDKSYYQTSLTQAEIKDYRQAYENLFEVAWKQRNLKTSTEFKGYLPKDLYTAFYQQAQSLYISGYATNQNLLFWVSEYKRLFNLSTPQGLSEQQIYNFWKNKYKKVFDGYLKKIAANSIGCANEGEVVGNKKCCMNHVKVQVAKEALQGKSCLKSTETCQKNNDCCSGICYKKTPESAGSCRAQFVCSRIRKIGEKCDKENFICAQGSCTNLDISDVIVTNSCKNTGDLCQTSSDCCSQSCVNNRCIEVSKCLDCVRDGDKLVKGKSCCPGFLNVKGRCVAPVPKYSFHDSFKQGILKSVHFVLNIFVSPAKAAEKKYEISEAQKQLIKEKRSDCQTNNAANSKDLTACLEAVDRLEKNYMEDKFTGLTQKQMDDVAKKREKCGDKFSNGSPSHNNCMRAVDKTEKKYLAENVKKGEACAKNNTQGSEQYRICMAKTGAMGVSLKKQDYINKYQIPGVTAKTYSDIKKCEFNSFNDAWRDASNKEKNAELFLRAFEYVYSHKGTQDYWEDGSKGNIFSRANKVAKAFRKNRSKMLKKMQEIDKNMACKCVAIFGPSNFSSVKQNFFNNNCDVQKKELQVSLGKDLNKGQKESKIDGTSISTLDKKVSEVDKDNARIEEIDKGAIAISHEKLLVEWLQLRAEAQVKRFVDNSDLEKELSELSDFISNIDFHEVFKDRISGKRLMKSNPEGHSVMLYKWGYTYRPGWFKIFNILTLGLGNGILANSFFDFDKGSAGYSKAATKHSMQAAWRYYQGDDIDSTPEIVDVKTVKGKCVKRVLGVCVKKMDGFHRYFLGPRFDNKALQSSLRCQTKGRASTCFKAGYREDADGYINYVMDPTLPLFVSENIISLNKMPKYTQTFPEMLRDATDSGIRYLKGRAPGGHIKSGYQNGGDSFGNQDHLGDAIKAGHFLPMKGKIQIENMKKPKVAVINGARKYALCKTLNDCGANLSDKEAIGFGYLFESSSEASEFAKYAYEIHYKWSHLTKNNYMGYPLVGMDQYFNLVAYNMKQLGSLASSRAIKYADAASLYNADWEKRVKEYNSLGEAAAGTQSRNIKYRKAFYDIFKKLNFEGETNLEVFNSQMDKLSKSEVFNPAEIEALNAAKSSALRRNADISSQKNLEKASANLASKTSQNALAENKSFLSKANSPTESVKLSKFGDSKSRGSGNAKSLNNLADAVNQMNDTLSSSQSDESGQNQATSSGVNIVMPSRLSHQQSGHSSNSTASEYGSSNNQQRYQDQNMSTQEVESLLKRLRKGKKELDRQKADTLFTIVSKAYKRNYDRVLKRAQASVTSEEESINYEDVEESDKEKLKALLEN